MVFYGCFESNVVLRACIARCNVDISFSHFSSNVRSLSLSLFHWLEFGSPIFPTFLDLMPCMLAYANACTVTATVVVFFTRPRNQTDPLSYKFPLSDTHRSFEVNVKWKHQNWGAHTPTPTHTIHSFLYTLWKLSLDTHVHVVAIAPCSCSSTNQMSLTKLLSVYCFLILNFSSFHQVQYE